MNNVFREHRSSFIIHHSSLSPPLPCPSRLHSVMLRPDGGCRGMAAGRSSLTRISQGRGSCRSSFDAHSAISCCERRTTRPAGRQSVRNVEPSWRFRGRRQRRRKALRRAFHRHRRRRVRARVVRSRPAPRRRARPREVLLANLASSLRPHVHSNPPSLTSKTSSSGPGPSSSRTGQCACW